MAWEVPRGLWGTSALGIALAAFAAAGSCTYPDFSFGNGSAAGGDGGAGGTGTAPSSGGGPASTTSANQSASSTHASSVSASSTAASSSSGGMKPQVSCKDPAVQCSPGEVCCYHQFDLDLDKCGTKGACGMDYYEFSCNSAADCSGKICCATLDFNGYVTGIACATSCNGSDKRLMCDLPSECSDNTCDAFEGSYPNYGWCN